MKAITLPTLGAIAITFAFAISSAACSSQETPSADATLAQDTTAEPSSFLDAPQTPGTWFYQQQPGQTRAVFGTAANDATFMIFCDAADRQITLVRADSASNERNARIRTETRQRSLTMSPPQTGAGVISARLQANDPLLDAMAITKGRFAVETAGLPALYLPAWVEVSRVIEDCR